MEITEIITLSSDYSLMRTKIMGTKTNADEITKYLKEYEPECHTINNTSDRPDRIVTVVEAGQEVAKNVKRIRLSVNFQKNIVSTAAAFLCGNPIQLMSSPKDDAEINLVDVVRRTWTSNKLDYESKKLAKIMMSETEVAELWYRDEADASYWANTPNNGRPHRLRMKVIANSLGDALYPVFNSMGDLVAFARSYFIKVDNTNVEHFDVYTDKTVWLGTKISGGWDVKPEQNWFGKIPVIYYNQPKPEWSDVQSLIDRFEKLISNHGEANDRHLFPMIKVTGELKGAPLSSESGNVLQLENGADAGYLEWKQITQSLELELKNLKSLINESTSTPENSIEIMKGLGAFSGIALKMLFLFPHMKAAEKEETFGKSIQRRINFIVAAMGLINVSAFSKATAVEITPKFEYFLPKNEAEIIDMLVSATGSKPIMTVKTAVAHNPLVEDKVEEVKTLKEEATAEAITPIN